MSSADPTKYGKSNATHRDIFILYNLTVHEYEHNNKDIN